VRRTTQPLLFPLLLGLGSPFDPHGTIAAASEIALYGEKLGYFLPAPRGWGTLSCLAAGREV
jgi:hypothetical protein